MVRFGISCNDAEHVKRGNNMSFKTNILEDINGLQVRCDIMPFDVCGKIVSMSEDGCGLFSRNRFDIGDELELRVLVKDEVEKCVVNGVITNIDRKNDGHTEDVAKNDNGWVYSVSIRGEHEKWKDVMFQFIMSHK